MTTLVGDPTWPETRWGLFRDGLPWTPKQAGYASLSSPRQLCMGPDDLILVADGTALALLSAIDDFRGLAFRRPCRLVLPFQHPKAGAPFRLKFTPPPGLSKASWTLALHDRHTGAELMAESGYGSDHELPSARFILDQAGPVEARLTVLTDRGDTLHDTRILTIEP